MARAWRCLEAGCDTVVTAQDDEAPVAAANAHVLDAHNSVELEEVILDAAEDVTDGTR